MIEVNVRRKLHGADGDLNLDFNTRIEEGQLVALYGPTGSGKSSILRMLAGLMQPHAGIIKVGDHVWFDDERRINVKPQHRDIGIVLQEYSLFPNMTVRGNLEFALKRNEDKTIIDELLDAVELTNLQSKKPNFLSGGQKQRVALARALVRKPKLLLMDEPLSALDLEMRTRLQDYILKCHHQLNLTSILVTHDYPEILKVSKRILVLDRGLLKFDGSPHEVLDHLR